MRGKGTVSLKFLFRSTITVFALVLVCAAMAAHEWTRHSARQSVFAHEAEQLAKAIVRTFARAATADSNELNKMCEQSLDPGEILAIGIFDTDGRRLAQAEISDALAGFLSAKPRSQDSTFNAQVENMSESDSALFTDGQFARVYSPLPAPNLAEPLTLGLLARVDFQGAADSASLWQFHLPLACILIGGVFVVDSRMKRQLVNPLQALSRKLAEESLNGNAVGFNMASARIDELTSISEHLESLRTDGRLWKRRAEINERRVDTNQARETKQIVRDLHRVKKEVWEDALTGVNNRRFLEEKFPEIFEVQRSSRRDLSVIMFDLDNFKRLNDTQGHGAGDEVLRFLGELLRQCVRTDDFAVRYGGDEFIMILPGVGSETALTIAERVLLLFAQRVKMMFSGGESPGLTAGVSSIINNQAKAPAELLECADHALLAAKKAGKRQAKVSTIHGEHFRNTGRTPRIQVRSSTPLPANL
jgi:diguanylate cyclase (GGDEF)-like protein